MIQGNFGRERIHHKVQGNREIKTKSNLVLILRVEICIVAQVNLF